ncbi:MAG: hypothetical protein ACAI44_26020 [Candidatus Sericytochromatia bacterium]
MKKSHGLWLIGALLILNAENISRSESFRPGTHSLRLAAAATQGLSPEQIRQLKALGIKIMLPSYIPKGYKVYSVFAETVPGKSLGSGPRYTVNYTGPNAEMFALEAASSGIGDPPADKWLTLQHPQLGKMTVVTIEREAGKTIFLTDWIGKGPFYHLVSPAMVNRKLQPQPVSRTEFLKLARSLAFVKL